MEKTDVFNTHYSQYYNAFYADKNYEAEVAYIDSLLKKYAPDAHTILEYGSGTGGHGLLLNKKGYRVLGIEQSESMAEIARAKGLACEVADITQFSTEKRFDACVALFHVISYINNNDQLITLFTNTRKHLQKNGLMIFDVWFTPAVLYQYPEKREKTVEDESVIITRKAVPDVHHLSNVVDVNYHITVTEKTTKAVSTFHESHPMRHFGVPEISLLAERTGFSVLACEEFLTGNAPSTDSWGVIFILQSK